MIVCSYHILLKNPYGILEIPPVINLFFSLTLIGYICGTLAHYMYIQRCRIEDFKGRGYSKSECTNISLLLLSLP